MKKFIVKAEGYNLLVFEAENVEEAVEQACNDEGIGEDEIEYIEAVTSSTKLVRKTEWVKS